MKWGSDLSDLSSVCTEDLVCPMCAMLCNVCNGDGSNPSDLFTRLLGFPGWGGQDASC